MYALCTCLHCIVSTDIYMYSSVDFSMPVSDLPIVSIEDEVTLNSLVSVKVRDVLKDSNRLFSTVTMQLENIGIQLGDINLRELVEHLQSHPYTRGGSSRLRDYISAPITGVDPISVDT